MTTQRQPLAIEEEDLDIEDGLKAVGEMEAEHGGLSHDELAAADVVLDAASVGCAAPIG